ncbi:hypothetical protein WME75_42040 [Sorangium sp. So ce1014]|uniref:hypothetical protein n=1 Tax=Sorangium sp. So ce1014 TaxID=3133326 RepID=UPI003F5E03E8
MSDPPHKPTKDAVWLGELVRGSPPEERYHRTRSACVDDLLRRMRRLAAGGLRVLVGLALHLVRPCGGEGGRDLGGDRGHGERAVEAHGDRPATGFSAMPRSG